MQTNVNALCSHRGDISFMRDLVSCHNSKRSRTSLECNEIPVLKLAKNLPEMNFIENVWNILKNDIDNQMPCLKEEMWKRVCEV